VVINTSHLAECFEPALGDGSRYGLHIEYSHEGPEPLETGGGMRAALPLLGDAPFIAINGDIHCDFQLSRLSLDGTQLAQLVLVDNPSHHPAGDFHLRTDGTVDSKEQPRLTFAGIGLYRPELLRDADLLQAAGVLGLQRFALAPLLRAAMQNGVIGGQHHRGRWLDVGTPARLAELDRELARS
jgi:MurNAc alpha-1-phosphate uridylyltransferase